MIVYACPVAFLILFLSFLMLEVDLGVRIHNEYDLKIFGILTKKNPQRIFILMIIDLS